MSIMIEILQRISDTKGAGCPEGICRELAVACDYNWDALADIWEKWEHYSGSPTVPVPDPAKPGDPDAAWAIWFDEGQDTWSGEYGELRLDLARHLLRELSK